MGLEQSASAKELTAGHELDLKFLSTHPAVAAEQLKITISKLQQIMSVSSADELANYFGDPNNATPLQSALFQLLLQNAQKQKGES
jgi:hypothetical protein